MSSRKSRSGFALAAALVVVAVVVGLASSSKPSTAAASAPIRSTLRGTNVSNQHYVWVAANVTDPFYVQGLAGWRAAAAALGVKVSLVGPPTADVQAQIADINTAIANNDTAGILVYPIDYTTIGPVLKKAMAAGIPVVLGNGDSVDKSVRDAFVGTSNVQFGQTAADLVGKLLHGKGQVGVVTQLALNHQQRVQGFKSELAKKFPNIKIDSVVTSDGSPTGEEKAGSGLIQGNPGLTAIWTSDAGSGVVARAVKLAGKSGKLVIVGSDRDPEELQAIKTGEVAATIVQDTYAEEYLGLYDLFWLHNKSVDVPDTLIDKDFPVTKANLSSLNNLK